jgi:hypothetical protein
MEKRNTSPSSENDTLFISALPASLGYELEKEVPSRKLH